MEGEKKRYAKQSEEREASLALLPPSFSFCRGCFYASLFCPFEIYWTQRREEKRRKEEKREERGKEERKTAKFSGSSG